MITGTRQRATLRVPPLYDSAMKWSVYGEFPALI
jgi:hypothetical protein